ncbi:MAG: radical SAM protein [Oligoflexia bacterium]|nr:radical SAM protein [Oligoflexia bacterium]
MRFNKFPICYEEPVFRPPSESKSLLLQVTIGCSHNLCTYCEMYRSKSYRVRSQNEIEKDLFRARNFFSSTTAFPRKVFLCDGDALSAEESLLLFCLEKIKFYFPAIARIGSYATASNILEKSPESLLRLKKNGLEIVYLGLETGSDSLLKKVLKDACAEEMLQASLKLKAAGIKVSTIVMIGLGGVDFLQEHALATAAMISKTKPEFLSFLITRPIANTPYYKMVERGTIKQLSERQCFEQMAAILQNLNLGGREFGRDHSIIFRANHVSNFLPIGGVLPRDTHVILETIRGAVVSADLRPLPLNFSGPM